MCDKLVTNEVQEPTRLSIQKIENAYLVETRVNGEWKQYSFNEFFRLIIFLTTILSIELDMVGLNALKNMVSLNNFNLDKEEVNASNKR